MFICLFVCCCCCFFFFAKAIRESTFSWTCLNISSLFVKALIHSYRVKASIAPRAKGAQAVQDTTERCLFLYYLYSYTEKSKSLPLVLPLACGGLALSILVVMAVLCFVRHRSEGYILEKKLREVQKRTKSQEMEVLQPENDPTVRLLQSLSHLVETLCPKAQAISKVLLIALDIVFVFPSVQDHTMSRFEKTFLEPS